MGLLQNSLYFFYLNKVACLKKKRVSICSLITLKALFNRQSVNLTLLDRLQLPPILPWCVPPILAFLEDLKEALVSEAQWWIRNKLLGSFLFGRKCSSFASAFRWEARSSFTRKSLLFFFFHEAIPFKPKNDSMMMFVF